MMWSGFADGISISLWLLWIAVAFVVVGSVIKLIDGPEAQHSTRTARSVDKLSNRLVGDYDPVRDRPR
jgi:hypothetical protein